MKRSPGVTAFAVVVLVGSALCGALGALVLVAVIASISGGGLPNSPATSPQAAAAIGVIGALTYFLPAAWGLVSGIGLLKLRNWARLSTIGFAVLLIGFSLCMGLLLFVMPLPQTGGPQTLDPAQAAMLRRLLHIVGAVLTTGGIMLGSAALVFLTRAGVRRQFVGPGDADVTLVARSPQPPVSIAIVGWFLIVSSLTTPFAAAVHAPAIVLTFVWSGRAATAYYLALAVLIAGIGVGLVRRHRRARLAAVGYFAATCVNAVVFYTWPGASARLGAMLDQQQRAFGTPMPPETLAFVQSPAVLVVGALVTALACGVPVYFLLTRKDAYDRTSRS